MTVRPVRREDLRRDVEEEELSRTRPLRYERRLDEDEAVEVRAGIPAPDMDHKWSAYHEAGVLHLLRSWTGFEIFSFRLRADPARPGGAIIDQVQVCDDRERFRADDLDATSQLDDLVDRMADGRL